MSTLTMHFCAQSAVRLVAFIIFSRTAVLTNGPAAGSFITKICLALLLRFRVLGDGWLLITSIGISILAEFLTSMSCCAMNGINISQGTIQRLAEQ